MQQTNLVDTATELHNIANLYKDHLTDAVLVKVRKASGMVLSNKITEDIEKIQAEGRLLNIGIIGRVKAGKSSLLNSLFFKGQSVLPKAATPMTAALTTMAYGESIGAEVQFYTQKELDEICSMAVGYDNRLESAYQRIFEENKSREQKRLERQGINISSEIDMEKKARRQAKNELGDSMELEAASQQVKDLQKAAPRATGNDSQRLVADSIEDLKEQLGEYVGSRGKYTPYTKSVDLLLPFEELKGIKVIDTPGVNDPIVSREQRTNQLLMQCDVVLIVAPSDKYFDTKDQQLVSRLTTREGLQHIYFVASQVDRTLNAPEYMGGLLSQSLPSLALQLSRHLESEIEKLAKASSDQSTVDALRGKDGKLSDRFVMVSAMADTISKKLVSGEAFEDDEVHAKLLIEELFEDEYQRDPQACLSQLAGIEKVRNLIEQSRVAKDLIISERCQQVIVQYKKIITSQKLGLLNACKMRKQEIENTDLVALQNNKAALEQMRLKLENALEGEYRTMARELERNLSKIDCELTKITQSLHDITNESLQTENYQREVEESFLFFFSTTRHVTDSKLVINTSTISSNLTLACNKYVNRAKDFFNEVLGGTKGFEKSLTRRLFAEFQRVYDSSDDVNVKIEDVKKAIRSTVASIPIPTFSIILPLPSSLKASGKLSNEAAEDFHSDAIEFISTLERKVSYEAGKYTRQALSALPNNFCSEFFEHIDKDIERAKSDIESKQFRLMALSKCLEDLGKIVL